MTPKELRELSKNLNVLYVEDDIALRVSAKKMFGQFFSHIDEADNGQEAWQMYQKNSYDLIITDINMPIMNGIELIKLIKSKSEYQAIIVTSAYNDADSLLGLIDLGVDKFLLKPMDLTKLIDCLVHTTFYINSQREYKGMASKVSALEAEITMLKEKLYALENGIPSSSDTKTTVEHLLAKEDYALLRALEIKLSKAIYDIEMAGDYPDNLKDKILSTLDHYGKILFEYESYHEVAIQLNKLDQSIENDSSFFENNVNKVCSLLEDVVVSLRKARKLAYPDEETKILIKSMMRIMATLRAE